MPFAKYEFIFAQLLNLKDGATNTSTSCHCMHLNMFQYCISFKIVTGHAAMANAHDASRRVCLACISNVPRLWDDYDLGVVTVVLTQATTLPEERFPCHPLPTRAYHETACCKPLSPGCLVGRMSGVSPRVVYLNVRVWCLATWWRCRV